jgi:polysaccharide export outer membrane protein
MLQKGRQFRQPSFQPLWRILTLIALLLVGLPCVAQIPGVTQVSAPYKLQVEDVLSIQVFGQQQITAQVPIGRDGRINPPFLDSMAAAGRTIDDLKQDLIAQYKSKMLLRDPIVSVTVVAYRQLRASIGGAVSRPGSVPIRPGDTVLALFNQGGGATPDVADLRRSFLRHANSLEIIPLDLYAMTVLGDMSQNYQVQDGDEITVPEERNNRINVQGAVQKPGQYVYHEPMTLEDAIALSGGEIRYRSKFSHTIVIRQKPGLPGQYVTIVANLVKFVRNGDQTQNITLQPGDFVYVPESDSPDFNQIGALFNIAYIFNLISGGTLFNRIFAG